MYSIQSTEIGDFSNSSLRPTLQFSTTLLYSNLRNWKALIITLGMPVIMLLGFWLPTLGGDEESQELMSIMFPAIILLSVIMPGLTQATRLTRWREQEIFQRFALTPVPLANLMVGAALSQIVIGVGQGVVTLLFGIFIVELNLTWQSVLLVLGFMVLAGATFIAFGSFVAALIRKSDIAGYVFFFAIMPLIFLASFPPDMMPESINAIVIWLPTAMAIELIGPLFLFNQLTSDALFAGLGLLIYTIFFATISARRFRLEV
ncbi:ABC transporter permease [Candidatus Leptofilum sp.]|uniref:ABC transporter permease n=1 Tax=Candidatus Leptofilum sp. TaxID=3241576 RepID=UPI003B5CAE34